METEPPSASTDLKAEQDLLSAGSEVSQHDSDNHQSASMKVEPPSTSVDLTSQQDLLSAGSQGHRHDLGSQSKSMKTDLCNCNCGSEEHHQDVCRIGTATVKVEQDFNQFGSERLEEQLYDAGSMGIKAEPLLYNLASDE